MAVYRIVNSSIYPCYGNFIDYLRAEREKIECDDLRMAMNLNIILNCACYIEGFLEGKLKSIVQYYRQIYNKIEKPEFEIRKPMNVFFNNIEDDLDKRISRCMGIDGYDDFFKLLLNKSIKQDKEVVILIEPVQVFFQLRNVIAHGREVSAYEKVIDRESSLGEEFFFGGYKKAETLLLKKGIIHNRFVDVQSANFLFVDEVTDYFLV